MSRARYTQKAHKRRRKLMRLAKGFYGGRSRLYRTAIEAIHHKWAYSFAHRRKKKNDFRRLWITRINAACRGFGISYNKFIDGLKKAKIFINRKILANLAITNKQEFERLIEMVKSQTAVNSSAQKMLNTSS